MLPSLCLQLAGICRNVRHHNHSLRDDCILCVITSKKEEELSRQVAGIYAPNRVLIFGIRLQCDTLHFPSQIVFGIPIAMIAPLFPYLLHSYLPPHAWSPVMVLNHFIGLCALLELSRNTAAQITDRLVWSTVSKDETFLQC